MFIATLFTIAKLWTQLKCPLIDEWIHTHTHTNNTQPQKNENL